MKREEITLSADMLWDALKTSPNPVEKLARALEATAKHAYTEAEELAELHSACSSCECKTGQRIVASIRGLKVGLALNRTVTPSNSPPISIPSYPE